MLQKPYYGLNHKNPGISAGKILSHIIPYRDNQKPVPIDVKELIKRCDECIMSADASKKIHSVLDDLEGNYIIAETPYGYVPMTESIGFAHQINYDYYRCKPFNENPIKLEYREKYDDKNFIARKVEHRYMPKVEISALPEGSTAFVVQYCYHNRYWTDMFEHEFAFKLTDQSPVEICNNWYSSQG